MENRALKILILEDRLEDVELIGRTLKKEAIDFISKIVDSKDDFEQALSEFQPEVILSDHALPQFNSLDALLMVKNKNIKVPFILVTGTVSEEFAVNCLKHGADDYILKSNLTRLPSAIMTALDKREVDVRREKAEFDLRNQNEELVKINHELDSFVYSVSHNLRSPLMSILGLINIARNDNNNNEQVYENYFDQMESSVHKLDETLKEILDYSRNARNEIVYAVVDMKHLIDEAIDSLKYMKGFSRINVKIKVDQKLPLRTDAVRLKVIINNLLSNAIKYSDLNKPDPYIEIEAVTSAQCLHLRFSDNGIGVMPEFQIKIFDMFFRGSEKSDGAGLGLYIVKEALKKLLGSIELESEMGKGSTFNLTIPNS